MLTHTFVHARGVGYRTESRLWSEGILTWEDFLAREREAPLPAGRRAVLSAAVREAQAALSRGDAGHFARVLAPGDTWRAFAEFGEGAAFLDIETTGAGIDSDVTVVGLYGRGEMRTFIRGRDLAEFPASLDRFGLLVTFFGRCFDVPVLQRAFPHLDFRRFIHVDLCFTLRRLGERGGLKEIERRFGIRRSPETEGLDGFDAVRLWQAHLLGSGGALDLLARYNAEDVMNLRPLMEYAYRALRTRLLRGSPDRLSL